jgi:hypothetical protein
MTSNRRQAVDRFRRLAAALGRDAAYRLTAQNGYTVTSIPDDPTFDRGDWDGSDTEAAYPNPSDPDTDLDVLADHYLFPPSDLSGDDPPSKSDFKAPFRTTDGDVSVSALMAILQAINGARGGFEGIDTSALEDGYDEVVSALVAAGEYDSADDAPDMKAASITAAYTFDTGDTATWAEDSDNQAYGVIRDRAQTGENLFGDRIDGDFALDATEDNPAYLLEILDERDDGWVPTGTMVGHRQDTLSSWTPDGGVMDASARDVPQASLSASDATLTVHAADDVSLGGIIWGAGDHDLALGGDPTPVRVPEDSIRPTFEALQEDVQRGDVTLGFDHPGQNSVAAQTGIVDIGVADEVALASDGRNIVLTDSELTNDNALQAAADGAFDDLDWSIVADVAVRRDQNGDIVTEDGRVVIDAARIRRIDAVNTGAVDAASIERTRDALPELQDGSQTVRQAASASNPTEAVQALRASATAISEHMNGTNIDPNVDDLDEARDQLEAAASIIDDQEDELESAKAKATGFQRLIEAHDIDVDDFEDAEAAAQAVIDDQTEDTRREIAELEADLAQFDTDDVDARASELEGNSPSDLRNTLNDRKATAFDVQQSRQSKGRAAAKDDKSGRLNASGGFKSGNDSEDADALAMSAMDGKDRIQAEAAGQSPAEYIRDEYGVEAGQHDDADSVRREILDALGGDA